MATKKTKKYADYSDATQSFMNAVESHLRAKFGSIEAQWDGLLQLLATQFELFIKCKEQVQKDGLLVPDSRNLWKPHPLLTTQNNAQIQIVKMVSEFGITPKAMKTLNVTDNNDDEFLESLVNGEQ